MKCAIAGIGLSLIFFSCQNHLEEYPSNLSTDSLEVMLPMHFEKDMLTNDTLFDIHQPHLIPINFIEYAEPLPMFNEVLPEVD